MAKHHTLALAGKNCDGYVLMAVGMSYLLPIIRPALWIPGLPIPSMLVSTVALHSQLILLATTLPPTVIVTPIEIALQECRLIRLIVTPGLPRLPTKLVHSLLEAVTMTGRPRASLPVVATLLWVHG